MVDLMNKVSFVTGATGGLGVCIAKSLANSGSHLALGYNTNDKKAAELSRALNEDEYGLRCIHVHINVLDTSSIETAIDCILCEFGKIDNLVHSAGVTGPQKKIKDVSLEEWNHTLAVNLTGPFLVTQQVLPHMIDRKYGRIVFLGSISGAIGEAGIAPYCAAKAGLAGLMKTIAREYAKHGITANMVSPGYTTTGMMEKVPPEILSKKITTIPVGRVGTGEEIADIVLSCLLPSASYLNGQIIEVNGGVF